MSVITVNAWTIDRIGVGECIIYPSGNISGKGAAISFLCGGEVNVDSDISEDSLESLATAMGVTPAILCGKVRKVFRGR